MDNELEFTPKKTKQDNVAGVSRSGRVCKTSMKLRDFELLDDVDSSGRSSNPGVGAKKQVEGASSSAQVTSTGRSATVGNVATAGLTSPVRFTPKQPSSIKEEIFSEEELLDTTMYTVKSEYEPIKQETYSEIENEHDMNFTQNDESSLDSTGSEFDELDESVLQDMDMEEDGFQAVGSAAETDYASPAAAQSICLLEKAPVQKKLVIKDGIIVGKAKTLQKDKGPRVTSYMLWAKEIRQELIRKNPEWDFSQTSKRLSELWATVPYDEKYIWRRRAIRLAAKAVTNKTSAGPLTSASTVVTTGYVQQQPRSDVSPPSKIFKSTPGTNRKSPGSGAVVVKNQLVPTPAALDSLDKMAADPGDGSDAIRRVKCSSERLGLAMRRGEALLTALQLPTTADPYLHSIVDELRAWLATSQWVVRELSSAAEDLPEPLRAPAVPPTVPSIVGVASDNQARQNVYGISSTVNVLDHVRTMNEPSLSDSFTESSPGTSPSRPDKWGKTSVVALSDQNTSTAPTVAIHHVAAASPSGSLNSNDESKVAPIRIARRIVQAHSVPTGGIRPNPRRRVAKPRFIMEKCPICLKKGLARSTRRCSQCEYVNRTYNDNRPPHLFGCSERLEGEPVACQTCCLERMDRFRAPQASGEKTA